MKRTPLYEKHLALEAKISEYAGFEMPIEYQGIQEEIHAVRNECGLFDVSHMGEIRVKGEAAEAFLNWLLSRPIVGRKIHIVSYVALCYEDGGTVDDFLVYRFAEKHDYWLVVNAANKDKDYAYLLEMKEEFYKRFPEQSEDLAIIDESDLYGQVAVQGPKTAEIMTKFLEGRKKDQAVIDQVLGQKSYHSYREILENGLSLVISRTGYTGEDGFEIYAPVADIEAVWDDFIALGCVPCGLGSRDVLRLEAGMPLYGNEMSAELNALDAGMKFIVSDHEPFIAGKLVQKYKLIPVVSVKKAIPRSGYPVKVDGKEVGVISSGAFSPTINKGIAYARVPLDFPEDVEEFEVEIHRKDRPFVKTTTPFYK